MPDQAVLDYIRDNLAQGYTEEQIRQGLLSAGNDDLLIRQAVEQVKQEYIQGNTSDTSLEQQDGNQSPAQDTQKKDNNFKTIFIGMSIIAGFLLLSVFLLIAFSGGSRADASDSGEEGLSDPTDNFDDFDDFPNESEIDDPSDADDTFDDFVDEGNGSDLSEDDIIGRNDTGDNATDEGSGLQCRIGVSNRNPEISVGDNVGLIATGNMGEPTEVSWQVSDSNIVENSPSSSTYTVVTGLEEGETTMTVTDNAVGSDCTYTVLVNVVD